MWASVPSTSGLSVSVPGLSCRTYTGYTDCRNSLFLALGQSSGSYAMTLKASSRWADQVRVSPISDAYDYFSLRSEAFNLVFSNEPNVVLSLASNRGSDGHVRVSAQVRNATIRVLPGKSEFCITQWLQTA